MYKPIQAEAEAAASLAHALVNGEDVSTLLTGTASNGARDIPAVLLMPVAVTPENVEEIVINNGFRSWAEICVGEFAAFCPTHALTARADARHI